MLEICRQMDTATALWVCLIPHCRNMGTHRAPGGSERQLLCCGHLEQFVAHILNPSRNPVFPLP